MRFLLGFLAGIVCMMYFADYVYDVVGKVTGCF